MGLGEHVADDGGGVAGVHEVVDDEPAVAVAFDGLEDFFAAGLFAALIGTDAQGDVYKRQTASPPAPMASEQMPPAVGVWLSEPTRVAPGLAKFSRWSWWQMPVPGPEYTPPNLAATVRRKRWSSGLRKFIWSVLWST